MINFTTINILDLNYFQSAAILERLGYLLDRHAPLEDWEKDNTIAVNDRNIYSLSDILRTGDWKGLEMNGALSLLHFIYPKLARRYGAWLFSIIAEKIQIKDVSLASRMLWDTAYNDVSLDLLDGMKDYIAIPDNIDLGNSYSTKDLEYTLRYALEEKHNHGLYLFKLLEACVQLHGHYFIKQNYDVLLNLTEDWAPPLPEFLKRVSVGCY